MDRHRHRVNTFLGVRVGPQHIKDARQRGIVDDVGNRGCMAVTPDDAGTIVRKRLRRVIARELGNHAPARRTKLRPFDGNHRKPLRGCHRQQAAGFEMFEDLIRTKRSGPPGRLADGAAKGPPDA